VGRLFIVMVVLLFMGRVERLVCVRQSIVMKHFELSL
jgi:hypothetical protein